MIGGAFIVEEFLYTEMEISDQLKQSGMRYLRRGVSLPHISPVLCWSPGSSGQFGKHETSFFLRTLLGIQQTRYQWLLSQHVNGLQRNKRKKQQEKEVKGAPGDTHVAEVQVGMVVRSDAAWSPTNRTAGLG